LVDLLNNGWQVDWLDFRELGVPHGLTGMFHDVVFGDMAGVVELGGAVSALDGFGSVAEQHVL
jgi:hypothetical protein